MTGWREVVLGDLCSRVTVGHVGRMAEEYVEEGVPFLRSQNVRPFIVEMEGMLRIPEKFHRQLSKSALRTGDVVVVRTGYPGTAAVVPLHLDGSNCADLVIITPSKELNPHMLAAIFNSSWGRSAVGGQLVGSAQQHFNVGSAKALRMRLPDRPEQDRIAAVLSAFGDLIENNRRRIGLLEKMAHAIYREWFVRFRYPGHEDAALVNSVLGPIPEDWRTATLGSLVTEVRRSVKPSAVTADLPYVPIDVIDSKSMTLRSFRPGSEAASSLRLFEKGDVLFGAMRAYFHKVCYAPFFGVTRSTCFVLQPSTDHYHYAAMTLAQQETVAYAAAHSSGSTIPYARWQGVLSEMLVPVPPVPVARTFGEAVSPLITEAQSLASLNRALSSARDLLIPRLVSGQIDVSGLHIDSLVEAAA